MILLCYRYHAFAIVVRLWWSRIKKKEWTNEKPIRKSLSCPDPNPKPYPNFNLSSNPNVNPNPNSKSKSRCTTKLFKKIKLKKFFFPLSLFTCIVKAMITVLMADFATNWTRNITEHWAIFVFAAAICRIDSTALNQLQISQSREISFQESFKI